MRKTILYFVFFLFLSLQFACSGQNVKQDENMGKVEKTDQPAVHKSSIDQRVIDESVATEWVIEIPEGKKYPVLTGQIAIFGNEPFTYFVLKINDEERYGLIGSSKFIDFLKSHHGKLSVAGKMIEKENNKWIEVFYVIQGGK